jgi:hypothetical protein
MMMVKERFIEIYGPPLFTFGRGGSGGAYQQIQIADNYPGLLDGIIPSATFPMSSRRFSSSPTANSYPILRKSADGPAEARHLRGRSAADYHERLLRRPADRSARLLPARASAAQRYDPVLNPKGVRCDVFDHAVNVYGRNPVTGFARRPIDNMGVQYGLNALRSGAITVAQFLDLNERIGGYDHDANFVPTRSVADPEALRIAHATGRVTNGGGGLSRIPIIDLRGYLDLAPKGDIHLKYHSFGLRDRLIGRTARGE